MVWYWQSLDRRVKSRFTLSVVFKYSCFSIIGYISGFGRYNYFILQTLQITQSKITKARSFKIIRLFENHRIRRVVELEGIWDFVKEDGKKYILPVPGCWEQHPDFMTHQGTGKYTKPVYVKKQGNVRLEFKGVSHTADVYFDEETPISVDGEIIRTRELHVRVLNKALTILVPRGAKFKVASEGVE